MFDETPGFISEDSHTLRLGSYLSDTLLSEDIIGLCQHVFMELAMHGLDDGELYENARYLDALVDLGSDARIAGSGFDEFVSEKIKDAFDIIDQFAPRYTYFGAHRDDASDFGVWIQWDQIDEGVANGKICAVPPEFGYILVERDEDRPPIFYNARTGEALEPGPMEIGAADNDGNLFTVEPGFDAILLERDDGTATMFGATTPEIIFDSF